MSTAAVSFGLRPRPPFGPALGRFRIPFVSLALSVGAHLVLVVALVAGAAAWRASQPKTYVVNLVPSVAAVGTPQARPTPEPPAKIAPPPVLPPRTAARDLPPARDLPAKDLPPARDLPAKDLPPARDLGGLPERGVPPRTAALPRAGDKETPAVGTPVTPRPAPTPTPAAPPAEAAPPPPPPSPALGQATGSPQGVGAVTLNVSDFPYAWYIQAVHRKIQERWEGRAIHGRQPEVIFVIARDGQLRDLRIGKSSGNPAYDQLARRAVAEANPFPPLPEGFTKSTLTIGLQFIYDPTAAR